MLVVVIISDKFLNFECWIWRRKRKKKNEEDNRKSPKKREQEMPSIPKLLTQKEKESRMREKRSLNFDNRSLQLQHWFWRLEFRNSSFSFLSFLILSALVTSECLASLTLFFRTLPIIFFIILHPSLSFFSFIFISISIFQFWEI